MRVPGFLVATVLVLVSSTRAQDPPASQSTPTLPKVMLIGDSIRLGYAPKVIERLKGKAIVVSLPANGGDSANVLKQIDQCIREQPDVIHFNCGLHDLKRLKADGTHQVELAAYTENLNQIVAQFRALTKASVVFANTTPIIDARHARRGGNFDRVEADVKQYNAAAEKVMRAAKVPVHDLHWVVEQEQGGAETMLGKDGTHYTPAASDRLAEAVADVVLRQLAVARYRPLPGHASGPEAASAYRTAQAKRDRMVPEVYRQIKAKEFLVPHDANEWKRRRPDLLKAVRGTLGDLPPRPAPSQTRVISRELRPDYVLEKVELDNGVDGQVSSLLLIPQGVAKPAPAILWLHSSTPDKTQILIPDTNGGEESLGELYVKRGYAVLAPDAYWHGDRVGTGPSGSLETGKVEQESLHKWNLWFGRTLWGMMVRDDQVALDYLCSRPEVDKARIGATGMSMGSTRAWWLAAVDDRVAAVVAVACLTRYQNLIAHGELRAHGLYYFANGLLNHCDTEGVLALIAPRPFLALTGDLDAGSPADGIRDLERLVGQTYQALGAAANYRSILYPDVGHSYTPEMRAEMLTFFERWLTPTPSPATPTSP
ncbi:Dienelactone hydrolase [Singulisphaera sp. GP187]|uniref:GDSL-type esterase/lipase family protein n=1 Tax=Singulisphaera sp. GP187 TaxID=1882752 RepID=UPI000927F5C5|nr:GDSL-type esterase/lipase family protein [Singulisphaera sp. GP187]SIO41020.1 Dienelactone hydrolase [Singulisphaera sp. GP187]